MDCIFSAIEERLGLPPDYDGKCWRFSQTQHRLAFHHHRELELNLVTQGEAVYLLDDRRYILRPGALVWLFPAQNHILLDRSPDFAMWILVAKPDVVARWCAGETYQTLRADNPAGSHCRRLSREGYARLSDLLQELTTVDEPARFNAGLAYALLSAWETYRRATGEEPPCRVHPAIEATARLLREKTEPTSLKQLAAQFGLSASRLSTLFKEQTGVPLARYRNQQRLERFLHLCAEKRDGRANLLTAALEAGFGSYAQFYRVFCETMGCPPAAYRDKQR